MKLWVRVTQWWPVKLKLRWLRWRFKFTMWKFERSMIKGAEAARKQAKVMNDLKAAWDPASGPDRTVMTVNDPATGFLTAVDVGPEDVDRLKEEWEARHGGHQDQGPVMPWTEGEDDDGKVH